MALQHHIFVDQLHLIENDQAPLASFITLGKNYIHYSICHADKPALYFSQSLYSPDGPIGKTEFDSLLSDRLLSRSARVSIAIDSGRQTLVPAALLTADKREIYFDQLHEIDKDDVLMSQSLNDEITELFLVKKPTLAYFKNVFSNIHIVSHSACLLMQYLQKAKKNPQQNFFFIHCAHERFYMSVFKKGSLQFYQSFDFLQPSDILYNLLTVVQNVSLNFQDVRLLLSGFSFQQNDIAALLSAYCTCETFGSEDADLPKKPEGLPLHILFHQYSLISCVS